MPTRTARTAWNGTLQEGSGQVELSSSKVGTYEVSFPKRAADDAGGTTSPEELIAAAHSACFAMQLSNEHRRGRRHAAVALEVTADVSLGPDKENGGFTLTGITLTVRGEVEGLDAAGFEQAAAGGQGRLPGQQGADRRRDHPGRRARLNSGVPVLVRDGPSLLGLAGLADAVEPGEQLAEGGDVRRRPVGQVGLPARPADVADAGQPRGALGRRRQHLRPAVGGVGGRGRPARGRPGWPPAG